MRTDLMPLFSPLEVTPALCLKNRIVMAPMTRRRCAEGVPGADVATYYRRRAQGGVGLIITEGAWIPHPSAAQYLDSPHQAPCIYGDAALRGWKRVVDQVHAAGGKIAPQLWHVGQTVHPEDALRFEHASAWNELAGPSGLVSSLQHQPLLKSIPASDATIAELIEAFATAAKSAYELGFDAVELHGAHGYLIDQFNWRATNLRSDAYRAGPRFASDVVRAVRQRTAPDFPIIMRISQWKVCDYSARLAETPAELGALLEPMADAGVDVFDCSQRRYWEGEFGTDLNLAAWVRKLTGRRTIAVGSVGLQADLLEARMGQGGSRADSRLDALARQLEREDFDLIAVGRALLANPDWPNLVRDGAFDRMRAYDPICLQTLD